MTLSPFSMVFNDEIHILKGNKSFPLRMILEPHRKEPTSYVCWFIISCNDLIMYNYLLLYMCTINPSVKLPIFTNLAKDWGPQKTPLLHRLDRCFERRFFSSLLSRLEPEFEWVTPPPEHLYPLVI